MSMPRRYLRSVRFCSDPLPTTGRTRRVAPSSIRLARASAILTEMPAAPDVSSSTTPRLIDADAWSTGAADASLMAAIRATNAVTPHSFKRPIDRRSLFGLDALQQDLCLGHAELAGAPIPEDRRRAIASNRGQLGALEENRIVGFPQTQRGLPVPGIGGPLVEEPRGRHITAPEQRITARPQPRLLS